MLPAAASTVSKAQPKAGPAGATSTAARNFLILTAGEPLLDALHSERFKRPIALEAVISEAVQDHDLIPLDSFLRSKESIYNRTSWASWAVGTAVSLPWHALSWGLRQAGVIEGGGVAAQHGGPSSAPISYYDGGKGRLTPNQFVVLANIEEAATAFMDKTAAADAALSSPFERVWSVSQFKRTFSAAGAVLDQTHVPVGAAVRQPRLSDMDLNVLLAFLARDKNAIVYDGHVVKLRAAGPGNTSTDVITEEDRAVAQLRELIDSLTHQTSVLSRRIDDLTVAAKDAVVRKNRVSALAALKQKKQAESALAARFTSLGQLEATAAKLEQASDQVQVVAAMDASAEALQFLNEQVGGVTGVEGVVDRLRDQMEAADEINRIIIDSGPTSTRAGASGIVIDDGEIDDELAALEQQERTKTEAVEQKRAEEETAKKEDAQKAAAEETRRRLESAGAIPEKAPAQASSEDIDAALEAITTGSFRNMTLKNDEPQAELAS